MSSLRELMLRELKQELSTVCNYLKHGCLLISTVYGRLKSNAERTNGIPILARK